MSSSMSFGCTVGAYRSIYNTQIYNEPRQNYCSGFLSDTKRNFVKIKVTGCDKILLTTSPRRLIRNLVKFHLMASTIVPLFWLFKNVYNGCSSAPLTLILAYKSGSKLNVSFTKRLISSSSPGSYKYSLSSKRLVIVTS